MSKPRRMMLLLSPEKLDIDRDLLLLRQPIAVLDNMKLLGALFCDPVTPDKMGSH